MELHARLNDECAALRGFVALLEKEQQALVGQRVDELLQLADEKIRLANQVAVLSKARQDQLPANISNTTDWIRQHAPQALKVWDDARQLAARAQQLNQLNGELIQTRLRYNQQALNALYGAAQNAAAGLYGANGQTTVPTTSRTLGSV